MNKLSTVLGVSLLGASLVAHAAVLDFNTSAVGVSGNAVPLLSASAGFPNEGGFVDEMFTYNGFTFEYQSFVGVPSGHAWIWLKEGSSFAGLGATYDTGPTTTNGFLAHGCLDTACTPISSQSFAITNTTAFTFQSIDIARYSNDTATINLYTNVGDLLPAQTIIAPQTVNHFTPITVMNTLFPNQLFTKITIEGYKGYYGIDNLATTPVPEASTYAMMLVGLAGLGAVVRRRKNAA